MVPIVEVIQLRHSDFNSPEQHEASKLLSRSPLFGRLVILKKEISETRIWLVEISAASPIEHEECLPSLA